MFPLKITLILFYLFFQKSSACGKKAERYNNPRAYCNVYSYYYGNCTYDRYGIREQLRLPQGKRNTLLLQLISLKSGTIIDL